MTKEPCFEPIPRIGKLDIPERKRAAGHPVAMARGNLPAPVFGKVR